MHELCFASHMSAAECLAWVQVVGPIVASLGGIGASVWIWWKQAEKDRKVRFEKDCSDALRLAAVLATSAHEIQNQLQEIASDQGSDRITTLQQDHVNRLKDELGVVSALLLQPIRQPSLNHVLELRQAVNNVLGCIESRLDCLFVPVDRLQVVTVALASAQRICTESGQYVGKLQQEYDRQVALAPQQSH